MDEYLDDSRTNGVLFKPPATPSRRPATAQTIGLRIVLIAVIVLVLGLIGLVAQTIATGGSPFSALLESPAFKSGSTTVGHGHPESLPSAWKGVKGSNEKTTEPQDDVGIQYGTPIVERGFAGGQVSSGGGFGGGGFGGLGAGFGGASKDAAPEMRVTDTARDFEKRSADKAPPGNKLPDATKRNDLISGLTPGGTLSPGTSLGPPQLERLKSGEGYYTPAKADAKPPSETKAKAPEETPKSDDGKTPEVQVAGPEPVEMNRKIIRTGEMDFEVDSYDVAVVNITRLIVQIKGAYISDTKSGQLRSGKLQGYVVVRMPPQFLDQFILDLRRDVGKIGELKMQRINSQDVTKQYTDMESALRAARTMEERILSIIKTGKGDIKDLITAENALGEWRTKIEKMEGEMRYYSNQVSLSTLTISLAEREVSTPFALVATENVSMRIEAEDVKKAHHTAEKAAIEAKGRVLRSEVKQHAAGQLEAVLHVELPPAARDDFGALLEKLGIVSNQESHRQQEARGAASGVAAKPTEAIKPKEHDTHFEVTFNNLVNIAPRNSTTLQIATEDVAGGYAKLHEAIARVKGQVRNTNLNETDKKNVNASIEFSVPTAQKPAIDKAIADVGPLLTRNNVQAPITDLASERKFGYQVTLVNVANIQPREKTQLKFEVKDVDQSTAKLKELVAAVKGRITDARTQRRPNGDVAAILAFAVPLAAKDALVRQFKETGKLIGQEEERFPQAPENDLAVAHIHVILAGESPYVPSDEGFGAYLRTGFYTSFRILAWCVMVIIIGASAVLPWSLLIWAGYKLYSRMSRSPVAVAVPVVTLNVEPSSPASEPAPKDESAAPNA